MIARNNLDCRRFAHSTKKQSFSSKKLHCRWFIIVVFTSQKWWVILQILENSKTRWNWNHAEHKQNSRKKCQSVLNTFDFFLLLYFRSFWFTNIPSPWSKWNISSKNALINTWFKIKSVIIYSDQWRSAEFLETIFTHWLECRKLHSVYFMFWAITPSVLYLWI